MQGSAVSVGRQLWACFLYNAHPKRPVLPACSRFLLSPILLMDSKSCSQSAAETNPEVHPQFTQHTGGPCPQGKHSSSTRMHAWRAALLPCQLARAVLCCAVPIAHLLCEDSIIVCQQRGSLKLCQLRRQQGACSNRLRDKGRCMGLWAMSDYVPDEDAGLQLQGTSDPLLPCM